MDQTAGGSGGPVVSSIGERAGGRLPCHGRHRQRNRDQSFLLPRALPGLHCTAVRGDRSDIAGEVQR